MNPSAGPIEYSFLNRPHTGVLPRPGDMVVPLSWEQEQIWLHAVLFPDLPLYNETAILRYRGELNLQAFELSLDEFCRRHSLWRTAIHQDSGTPHQRVGPPTRNKIQLFDLAANSDAIREQRLSALVIESSRELFDLARGPLFRVFAARYGSEDTRIFLTLHHLIFDGASLRQIVLPELISLYNTYSAGHGSPLPPVELQYADYATRQRANGALPRQAAINFWRSTLVNFSPLSLPTDRPPSAQTSRRGGVHFFHFDETLTNAVLQMARRERTTPFIALLTSFIVLLARSADTLDVTLGTSYGGRATTELEGVLGCFLNTLMLRSDLTGDPSFRELLKRVRGVTLDAFDNADAPFQEIVRQCLSRTSMGDSPIQAVFAFQPPSADLPPEWELNVFDVFNGCAKFDLHLEIEQEHGSFRGRLMYNADLFDAATIERMQQHWLNLIRAAIQTPDTPVWRLNLLSPEEQAWLLNTVNDSKAEVPQLCVHDLFVRIASEKPESVAISFHDRRLTYRELDHWSARVAMYLGELGLGAGSVIGLMIERSPEMLVGLLGILRAGATYVPLDPMYPAARLDHMIRASGAGLILTQGSLMPRLREVPTSLLDISDCLRYSEEECASSRALPRVSLSASAYIIFTSGSTGLPKGVEISHLSLTNLLWSMRKTPGIGADDILLAVTSISFDIAALELYLPLIEGARIEQVTAEDASDPRLLSQKLLHSGATIMQATPATWRMLIDIGWKPSRPIKILCGGEAMTQTLARQLLQRSNSVWNMYGPTETTIWSACGHVESELAPVVLGDPVANTNLYVLDTHQALVPAGIAGELYIGGTGLAKGYCGQPELTSERFPLVSIEDGEMCRLYRTGDRVKRLRDGSLLFLGRTDRQVKLNGFRIELGEIEAVLNSLPGVQESVVLRTNLSPRGDILAAFVVPKAGSSPKADELRTGLARLLPAYMQPSVLHILRDVPLTLNGKLDRTRLPDLLVSGMTRVSEQPNAGTEQMLANIWCEVLSVNSVGRRENFFDVGGHSLLAGRFVSLVNRAFDRECTLGSFIQAPTIAEFAQIVEGRSPSRTRLLKRGAMPEKQLLWIGAEPWLTRFADNLQDDLTLYSITPDVASVVASNSQGTVEEMAGQILEQVREVQAHGPYLLGGFCLRSLLAYELAQRLQREGEEIALLILGDLYAPGREPKWTLIQRWIRRVHRESSNLSNVVRSPAVEWIPRMRRLGSSWMRLVTNTSIDAELNDELLQALYKAELSYIPAPFSGKVLFLESEEGRLLGESTSGTWKNLISDIEVFRYPGNHENILNEPLLRVSVAKIQQSIDLALCAELSLSS